MTPVLDSEGLAEAVLRDRELTTWLAVARAADERVIFSPPILTTWPCSAVTGDGEGVTASQDGGPGPPCFAWMRERASRELVNAIAAGVVRNGLVVTFTVVSGRLRRCPTGLP